MKTIIQFFTFIALFVCSSGVLSATANANILITPTRIVFEDRDRFSVVTLVNNGDTVKSYEMDWVHFSVDGNGEVTMQMEKTGGGFDLSEHIVFSPRRVTLEPGAKQKIRLALRRPETIPDGDYSVHFRFHALPDPVLVLEPGQEKKMEASIKINVSYTIPVVLRVGEARVTADIGQINMSRNNTGALDINIPVTRSDSPYAVLGWLKVFHETTNGEELVGEISNAHIFTEMSRRDFVVPLKKELSGGGRLRIVLRYYDLSSDVVYAEKVFPLE